MIIKNIGEVAYKLDLLLGSHIHHVFYITRLKKCLLDERSMVDGAMEVHSPLGVNSRPDYILDMCVDVEESYFSSISGVLERPSYV